MIRAKNEINILLNIIGIIFLSIFILHIKDHLFTYSTDLAHHYALIDNLSKYSSVNNSFGNLGEMAYYPNWSHRLASIFGGFYVSNIAGLSFVSIFSLAIIWLIISFFILNLKPFISILTLLFILIVGLFSNYIGAFHGKEIIVNFFYSQLVGEAFAYIVLFTAYFLFERRKLLIFMLLVSSLLLEFFHLLPAIQILGLSFLIVFYDMYKKKKFDYIVLSILFAGLVLFIFHPSFEAMQSIGDNNGHLSFPFMRHPTEINYSIIILLILFSVIISVNFIMSEKYITFTSIRLLSFFSLSNSTLMALQTIALSLGHGSEYAVKKYIFTLITLTVILCCILIAFSANKFFENRYKFEITLPKFFVGSIFSSIIIVMQLSNSQSYSLNHLKEIEKNLQIYEQNYIQDSDRHKAMYLDKSNILQYMFSISVLEHPRDSLGMTLLSSNIENAIYSDEISYIFIKNNYFNDETSKNFVANNSAFLNPEGYFVLDKKTFLRAIETKYSDIQTDNGLKISAMPQILKTGWHNIENWGVWSSEHISTIFLRYSANKTFNKFSFTANAWHKDKNVTIQINGIDCGSLTISSNKQQEYTANCIIAPANNLRVDFYIEDWNTSPKKLNLSEDARNLGIGLINFRLH